jgi:hypothetical protein
MDLAESSIVSYDMSLLKREAQRLFFAKSAGPALCEIPLKIVHYLVHCLAIRMQLATAAAFTYIMNRLAREPKINLKISPMTHGTFIISVCS